MFAERNAAISEDNYPKIHKTYDKFVPFRAYYDGVRGVRCCVRVVVYFDGFNNPFRTIGNVRMREVFLNLFRFHLEKHTNLFISRSRIVYDRNARWRSMDTNARTGNKSG